MYYRPVDVHYIEEEEAGFEDGSAEYYDGDTDLYEDVCDDDVVLTIHSPTLTDYVDGFGFGAGTIDRRTVSSRCPTPSMILASLISLEALHPSDTIVTTSAQV